MIMRERCALLSAFFFLVVAPSRMLGQFTLLFPTYPIDRPVEVTFVNSTTGFYATSAGSLFRTTDCGQTWQMQAHYQGDPITSIKFVDSLLGIAASSSGGLWFEKIRCLISSNGGAQWSQAEVNLSSAEDFIPLSKSVILRTEDGGISRLDNFYGQWTRTFTIPTSLWGGDIIAPYGSIHQLHRLPGGDIIALVSYQRAFTAHVISDSVSRIIRSSDSGVTWDTLWKGTTLDLRTVAFATAKVGWMGGERESLFKTTDGGVTWIQQHLDTLSTSSIRSIITFDTLSATAVDGTGTLFRTSNGGANWTTTVIEATWETTTRLAFPTRLIGFYAGSELYRTLDGGSTWQPVNNRIHETATHMQFVSRTLGFVLTDKGFYVTSDGGSSWSPRNDFSANPVIAHFQFTDSLNGWAVGEKHIMKTTDGGTTWSSTPLDPKTEFVRGVHFCNKDLGVVFEIRETGSNYASLLVTSNGGATWSKRTINEKEFVTSWHKMEFTGPDHLWFANQQGLWLSRDTAQTWQLFDSLTAFDSGFDMIDSVRGFCDNSHYKFGYTTTGGQTWTMRDKPYPSQILDVAVINPLTKNIPPVLFAGDEGTLLECQYGTDVRAMNTYTQDLLRNISIVRNGNIADVWVLGSQFQILHNSYLITGVEPPVATLPAEFALEQNYPNPFNPTTKVGFVVGRVVAPRGSEGPVLRHVRLVVYDLLGREVAVLMDETKPPGKYEVTFDASGLSSGVYICRLTAGDFVASRKMLLLR
jgi:photosystem II stability/assembly factor-like uncharacterized protein